MFYNCYAFVFPANKRAVYDRYGKEGLSGNNGAAAYDFNHDHFNAFRDPFEVFREFFGGRDPFADFFGEQHTGI